MKGQAEAATNASSRDYSERIDLASSKTFNPTSDNLPVPSLPTKPGHKHSSDSTRSLDSQPIIHPECQVNEFETDTTTDVADHEMLPNFSPIAMNRPNRHVTEPSGTNTMPSLNIDDVSGQIAGMAYDSKDDTVDDDDVYDDDALEEDDNTERSPGHRLGRVFMGFFQSGKTDPSLIQCY